jgi:hypothetical protein
VVVCFDDASVAAELLREHISEFQGRYIREWNEKKAI